MMVRRRGTGAVPHSKERADRTAGQGQDKAGQRDRHTDRRREDRQTDRDSLGQVDSLGSHHNIIPIQNNEQ